MDHLWKKGQITQEMFKVYEKKLGKILVRTYRLLQDNKRIIINIFINTLMGRGWAWTTPILCWMW